jgi:hypothetical protein
MVKPAGPKDKDEFAFKRLLNEAVPPTVKVPADVIVDAPLNVTVPEPVKLVVETEVKVAAPVERIWAAAVLPVGT